MRRKERHREPRGGKGREKAGGNKCIEKYREREGERPEPELKRLFKSNNPVYIVIS